MGFMEVLLLEKKKKEKEMKAWVESEMKKILRQSLKVVKQLQKMKDGKEPKGKGKLENEEGVRIGRDDRLKGMDAMRKKCKREEARQRIRVRWWIGKVTSWMKM